ncbi:MAG: hypothetical protein DCF17_03650 [Shackletoniella antarctica]|uniref:Uncharacterized protein n=1 Tax=Shackletoniella antarctica TaxID=268115 RepID=A0A2W4WSC7_9CYAN|nr:MAG: hypothetical protein DCF17_03650 [Shackletoniella antarctica]
MGQSDPPKSPRETLPTMYDLPSEFPEEPGLPDVGASPSRDVFHDLQPQLLSRTLALSDYSRDQYFTGSDLNVYYDVHHPLWHKRPDWFLAVGVPRLYDGHDLRRSYVVYSRYTQRLRYFKLIGRQYKEQAIDSLPKAIWLEDLNIGLGIWEGEFEGIWGHWLRWCNAEGCWLPTDTETAQERANRLAQRLRELGVDPDQL